MFLKKHFSTILILILVLLGVWAGKNTLTQPFFTTHDGDHHIARSLDAVEALSEGQFPLRWAGKLNNLCGVPIFNFFYPLIYYLAAGINLIANNVPLSLEIILFTSFIVGPLFFFLWLKKETKNSWASFIGALVYLFVPYRFLLAYLRFSPEFMAYLILPIFLYQFSCLLSLLKKKPPLYNHRAWWQGFSLVVLGMLFIISHNLVVLAVGPILAAWVIFKIYQEKAYRGPGLIKFWLLIGGGILLLSSFFWGPMILEQRYTKLVSSQVFPYYQHFPTLKQLISSPWGRWYSMPGQENDGMSFKLGYAQWFILATTSLFLLYRLITKKTKNLKTIIFWYLLTLLYLFLMLEISSPVWQIITPLQRIQFPWRLLGVTSFTLAALVGFLANQIKRPVIKLFLVMAIGFLAIYGNRNHMGFIYVEDSSLYQDFSYSHPFRYTTTTVGDDIINPEALSACINLDNFLTIGSSSFSPLKRGNSYGQVNLAWPKEETNDAVMKLAYFPGIYQIEVNDNLLPKDQIGNNQGLLKLNSISLNKGENKITWQIIQSPLEKVFNCLSLASLIIWGGVLVGKYVTFKRK
jgi:type IV secretory pathway VirB3-like protein